MSIFDDIAASASAAQLAVFGSSVEYRTFGMADDAASLYISGIWSDNPVSISEREGMAARFDVATTEFTTEPQRGDIAIVDTRVYQLATVDPVKYGQYSLWFILLRK